MAIFRVEVWWLTFRIGLFRLMSRGRSRGAAVFVQIFAGIENVIRELFDDVSIQVRTHDDA
jgi:hypothetical protein